MGTSIPRFVLKFGFQRHFVSFWCAGSTIYPADASQGPGCSTLRRTVTDLVNFFPPEFMRKFWIFSQFSQGPHTKSVNWLFTFSMNFLRKSGCYTRSFGIFFGGDCQIFSRFFQRRQCTSELMHFRIECSTTRTTIATCDTCIYLLQSTMQPGSERQNAESWLEFAWGGQ